MNISSVRNALSGRMSSGFEFYERRPGQHQLIVPILHEDGDMVDIYPRESPKGDSYVRVCDFGMALMRLSYSFDLSTSNRQRIFDSILINNGVSVDEGDLYIDVPMRSLYEGILQFAGCVQKVCNLRYWNREVIRSVFYEDLQEFVTTELARFSPVADRTPLPDDGIFSVDWSLVHNRRDFFLFGVHGRDKARSVAISLIEFQKARLAFTSMVVHEHWDELGKREQQYLMRNADKQYPGLKDFRETGPADIERLAAIL